MNILQLSEMPRLTAQQASGTLPNNADFRAYVAHRTGKSVVSKADAEAFIRAECGIVSRRELASNAGSAILFFGLTRRFVEWSEQQ